MSTQNKIKEIIGRFAIITIAIAAIASGLSALEVPPLKHRVNDYANMLSPQTVSTLEAKLEQLEKTDSTQLVILTIPSLEGDTLEDFSIRAGEKWKIGQKKLDNGVMLIISKNDRAVRIEVGYGLEGKLTDLVSGRIIDDIIIPDFRNGDFDAGVEKGADAIIAAVKGEFQAKDFTTKKKVPVFPTKYIFFVLFILFLIASVGRAGKIFSGILGAVLLPVIALILLPVGLWILIMIPIGFILGLILPFFMSGVRGHHGGGFFGGGGGGFSSFGGGGGFSGGGGGFGGGGASGKW